LDIGVCGSLHPNKRADSFRALIAGAPAFNAVSRSSLLLAQHPEDEHRRVLVRGKGNLSRTPTAIEFDIIVHRFSANGHQFNVPLAAGFAEGTLTVDDLVGDESSRAEHSKVADAAEIIEALLPKDNAWHPAKPMFKAGNEEDIDERTMNRAKARLGLEHRRTQTFPAATEWRWPATQDTHRTRDPAVRTVPTVRSVNSPNRLRRSSSDTQDTQDSENTTPECVLTAEADLDAELERLQAKLGGAA